MEKPELQVLVSIQEQKIQELTRQNTILLNFVYNCINPLVKSNKRKMANEVLNQIQKGYKPVSDITAFIFKKKKEYPFLQLENYIDTREGKDE